MTARIHDQSGTAIIGSLIMMVVISAIVISIAISSQGAIDAANRKTAKIVGMPVTDSGAQQYLRALDEGLTDESTGYLLDAAAISELLGPDAGNAIRTSQLAATYPKFAQRNLHVLDSSLAPANSWTVAEPMLTSAGASAGTGFWQLYGLIRPRYDGTPEGANLIVMIRGWVANDTGTVTTEPRIVRVEFRPGRFSDFQMVADGPITLETGATVNGPIHSNGYRDTLLGPSAFQGVRISDGVKCDPGASFSTRAGDVVRESCSDVNKYPQTENTGQSFSMLRITDSFTTIAAQCSSPIIFCRPELPPPSNGTYKVRLYPSGLVRIQGTWTFQRTIANGAPAVFLLPANVRVRGFTNSRITIAASGDSGRYGSSAIYIDRDTGSVESNKKAVLGLVAQGDVIPTLSEDMSTADACPEKIYAAIASASGTFAVPPQYRIAGSPGRALPRCLKSAASRPYDRTGITMDFRGSIAGHFGPEIRIAWENASVPAAQRKFYVDVGYQKRTYRYNRNLFYNPPPFYPTTGPWQIAHWKDVNLDCVGVSRCR